MGAVPEPRRPSPDDADIEAVFAALADPTRRAVLLSLAAGEPATATRLADAFPVTRQAVAKHLVALAEAGLVAGDRSGRELRFRAVSGPLHAASAWLDDVADTVEQGPARPVPAARTAATHLRLVFDAELEARRGVQPLPPPPLGHPRPA